MMRLLPICPNRAAIGLPIKPEGPKIVALIPESLSSLIYWGSLMKSFFSTANEHFPNAWVMCFNININIFIKSKTQ